MEEGEKRCGVDRQKSQQEAHRDSREKEVQSEDIMKNKAVIHSMAGDN